MRALACTDAVVVVLSALQDSARVFFEAGVALGLGLPLLVMAEADADSGPLKGLSVAQLPGGTRNEEALRFHLGLFITSAARAAPAQVKRPPSPLKINLLEQRAKLDALHREGSANGRMLERWAVDLFRAGGAKVAEASNPSNRGLDLVAELEGLNLPGPLVVEVKGGKPSSRRLLEAALQLQYLVLQERAGLGLLLFDDAAMPAGFALQVVPMVVCLGAAEPLSMMEQHGSLADAMRSARNEAVHQL